MKTFQVNSSLLSDSTINLTTEEAEELQVLTYPHFDCETVGPWQIVRSIKGLCISKKYTKVGMFDRVQSITIYGPRKASDCKQSGYAMDGRVSIKGKKHTCFTSAQLFEIDGKLIDIPVLFARI